MNQLVEETKAQYIAVATELRARETEMGGRSSEVSEKSRALQELMEQVDSTKVGHCLHGLHGLLTAAVLSRWMLIHQTLLSSFLFLSQAEMDGRGDTMSDSTPLVKIKRALKSLKEELTGLDMKVRVVVLCVSVVCKSLKEEVTGLDMNGRVSPS
jgi:hypothetical protein